MAILMLLTALTYGRLQSFRSYKGFAHGFNAFVASGERDSFNRMMREKYDGMKVVETQSGAEKAKPVKASSKLNLGLLINPGKDAYRTEVYMRLLRDLIDDLYGSTPYFQRLEEKRPAYLEELLAALSEIEPKPKKLSELDNVKLSDPLLNEILYRLLKKRNEGPSLTDALTIRSEEKIRIYLAPKVLLQAIYRNPEIVAAIMSERENLYSLVTAKEGLAVDEASKQFDLFLKGFPTPAQPYLNSQVSKTSPRR